MFKTRSPRLAQTSSGPGMPLNEALRTEFLDNKVKELEKALGDADKEMEEVVARMNLAQIEVAELQNERLVLSSHFTPLKIRVLIGINRDEALRQTRRLEAEISKEREKILALMYTQ